SRGRLFDGISFFRLAQRRNRYQAIAVGEIHQPDALRVAADRTQIRDLHPDNLSLLGHQQQLVAIGHTVDADDAAVAFARLSVLESDAAARLAPVLVDVGPLAETALADREQRVVVAADDLHADDFVSLAQLDAADAVGAAAHRPRVFFAEANRHAVARADHE